MNIDNDGTNQIDGNDDSSMCNRCFEGKKRLQVLTLDLSGRTSAGIKNWALPGNIKEAIRCQYGRQ